MNDRDPSKERRKRRPVLETLIMIALLWVLAMAIRTHGWGWGFVAWLAFPAAVCGVISLADSLRSLGWAVLFNAMTFGALAFMIVGGTFRSWNAFLWDAAAIAAGIMIVGLPISPFMAKLIRRKERLARRSSDLASVAVLGMVFVLCWASITVFDRVRARPLALDVARFAAIPGRSIVPDEADGWSDTRVAPALSGGGARAALVHAGVLHALENLGVRVRVLSTVSGGSIIGAYYAAGGDPVAFRDAVVAGRFNLKRELFLLDNAVRLIAPMRIPIWGIELWPFHRFHRGTEARGYGTGRVVA